ncbi:hypothetical protein VPH35_017069 [Triticum aestivum]
MLPVALRFLGFSSGVRSSVARRLLCSTPLSDHDDDRRPPSPQPTPPPEPPRPRPVSSYPHHSLAPPTLFPTTTSPRRPLSPTSTTTSPRCLLSHRGLASPPTPRIFPRSALPPP